MRRAAIAIALVALAAPVARAQPQMPDPRRISGVARPQPGDPPGQLTIRVVQGKIQVDEFGNSNTKFPPGQIVHLIALGSDGSVTKLGQAVDAQGRAVFQGLATDGRVSYYAMALLPRGELQDRVATQDPVVMPPQVGVRMMLAGLDPESTEPAVDDLSDPRLPPLDPGEVIVDVRGMYESVDRVTLREVGADWSQTATVQPLEGGRVTQFSGVPSGNDHIYVAEVVVDGRVYRSVPIELTDKAGGYGSIFVYPNLLVQFHTGAEVDDQKLWFQIQFTMANGTGTPFDPGDGGIFIPLPRGTVNASVNDDTPRVIVDKDRGGFVWRGVFPPGQQQFIGQFALPIENGAADMVLDLPYGAIDSQLSVRTRSGVADDIRRCIDGGTPQPNCTKQAAARIVAVEQPHDPPPAMRFSTLEGDVTFLVMGGLNLRAGDQLKVRFLGLPSPPAWIGASGLVVGFAVLFLIALGVGGVFWHHGKSEALADARRAEIAIERDKLFDQLVALERSHREGRAAGDRYTRDRADCKAQIVKLDEELRGLR